MTETTEITEMTTEMTTHRLWPELLDARVAAGDARAEPEPNLPLLRETLAWVREQDARRGRGEPSAWDQSVWRSAGGYGDCGTVCCFAARAAELAGGAWLDPADPRCSVLAAEPADEPLLVDVYYDSSEDGAEPVRWICVPNRARRVLGLTYRESQDLFYNAVTLADVEAACAAVAARTGEGL